MNIHHRNTATIVAALFLTTACSPAVLPPPAPPPREMPAIRSDLGPPAPGKERVLLDTLGEEARVSEVTSHSQTVTARGNVLDSEHDRPLCITPCAVDLKLGLHDLSFQSTTNPGHASDVEVQVQGDPLVVRHEMAELRTPNPALQGTAHAALLLGVVALPIGGILTGAGVAIRNMGSSTTKLVDGFPTTTEAPGPKGVETAGLVTLGVSAGLVLVGAIASYLTRDEYTPGATTEWTLPRSGDQVSSAARPPNTLFAF
jgi:hypothetical protein